MVRTTHKYIDEIKVQKGDTSLILGTIHPHKTDDFLVDFFYGNMNSLWSILGEAFPKLNFISKDRIVETLRHRNIWISDMIAECERKNEQITQDKDLENLVLNVSQIEEGLKKSTIKTIFFTSAFGKNNAAKLFCNHFKIKADLSEQREFKIPHEIFGREIKGVVLFSPSGQANIGISRNKQYLKKKEEYNQYKNPVSKFKVDFYREAFKHVFEGN